MTSRTGRRLAVVPDLRPVFLTGGCSYEVRRCDGALWERQKCNMNHCPKIYCPNKNLYLRSDASPADERKNEEDGLSSERFNQLMKSCENPRLFWMKQVLGKTIRHQVRSFKKHCARKRKKPDGCITASENNIDKNRFDDIPCLDNCRVVLRGHTTDYIHANYLILRCQMKFICTQGPMNNTVKDFWHMIIQENCHLILMLCNFREDNQEKCYQYCPTEVGASMIVGDTSITVTRKVVHDEGYTESWWGVRYGSKNYEIKHLHITIWRDHSAPKDPDAVIAVYRELLGDQPKTPIVIHCSAGVGRTCTFVGGLLLLERILERDNPSGLVVINEMRKRRFGAVQRSSQFVFMHYVLMELFCQDGVMDANNPKMSAYRTKFHKLIKKMENRRSGKDAPSELQLTSEIK